MPSSPTLRGFEGDLRAVLRFDASVLATRPDDVESDTRAVDVNELDTDPIMKRILRTPNMATASESSSSSAAIGKSTTTKSSTSKGVHVQAVTEDEEDDEAESTSGVSGESERPDVRVMIKHLAQVQHSVQVIRAVREELRELVICRVGSVFFFLLLC